MDAINVTSACYDVYNAWLEPTSFEPGWRAYLAKEIKSVVSIPVIAANYMRSPEQADRSAGTATPANSTTWAISTRPPWRTTR